MFRDKVVRVLVRLCGHQGLSGTIATTVLVAAWTGSVALAGPPPSATGASATETAERTQTMLGRCGRQRRRQV